MLQFGSSFVIGFKNLEQDKKKQLIDSVQYELGKGLCDFEDEEGKKHQIGVGYDTRYCKDFLQVTTGKGKQPIDDPINQILKNILTVLSLDYLDSLSHRITNSTVVFFKKYKNAGEIIIDTEGGDYYKTLGDQGGYNCFHKISGEYVD